MRESRKKGLWLWVITFIGVIVPRHLRADWRQEWEAELQWRERQLAEWDQLRRRNKLDLLWHSLGAFLDALWLQPKRLEDEMFQDLKYGWRMLLKNKGFTIVAVISLALGIGANTAQFSLVDTVLLRMLPVTEPERLVLFEWEAGNAFRTGGMRGTFVGGAAGRRSASIFTHTMIQTLQQARAQAGQTPMSDLFAFAPLYEMTALVNDQAEVVRGQGVSGGYYNGLGVQPILGRTINDADDNAASSPVVVISHKYWQERFAASPTVIGQQLKLNNTSFTIIGVTPVGFRGTLQVGQNPEVTVPLNFEPVLLGDNSALKRKENRELWWVHLMGRLKPGASFDQARESLNATFQATALQMMPPPRKDSDPVKIESKDYPNLKAQMGGRGLLEIRKIYSRTIYGLFAVVVAVLLIACANVANLLLARAALRGPEISVRLAVGAGRWRLIRQLLTESVLLAAIGGVAGILVAYWGKSALAALATRNTDFLPVGVEPSLSWRVLAFTAGVSLLTGIVFGLAPAWRATKADVSGALKQGRRSSGGVSKLSKGLIVAQVALSLLLLFGAGLFIRTLNNLQKVNLGFNQENLLTFSVDPRQGGYKDERLTQFYQQLSERLDALPGVQSATFASVPLISQFTWNTDILLPGESEKTAGDHIANRQAVRENYFSTMQIPLLLGRGFTTQDTPQSPKVAIVNQDFVRKFFPNNDALGKRVREREEKDEVEIVGIVADHKYSSQREEIEPLMYTHWRQASDSFGGMYFALRTNSEPTAFTAAARQTVRDLDVSLPVTEVRSQKSRSEETLSQERLYARLLSFFGLLALVLAAIGLSGVLAYSVAQRTNEIGIRMALGAQATDVLQMVIRQGLKLVVLGLAVGAGIAYALKRLMASQYFGKRDWQRQMVEQLYGVRSFDPLLFASITGLLLLVALLACWLPARRAARVDPLDALRHD
ncbi:MAG TPA: ABC transporter permease [Blastocatellia bacterium]|nr:ABC transporter permease [Blastocatellia bacterium]HMX28411.1 ABC transporter permease [Blastocatellia bacterium]HMY74635.1 ABC transporter permease [Blastocatellia bacterium]HMZ17096.1 ABC transporter permease [Blastocatellia bacterium]HNG32357.1 ABC transporter permease [Blastocatellia bacterium]